jgi:hypothetical protein
MNTWLFQSNPSRFDLDAFLAAKPAETEWLVSRHMDRIQPGDRVFLWRSGDDAGVFAEATTLTTVRDTTDDPASARLWVDKSDGTSVRPRVRIAIRRVANKKEVIKRDWWKADPVLRDHLIMRMANHTTFAVEEPQLSRLCALWERTAVDWTYAESLAGLHAYYETIGKEVSKLPGSPVATVALLIGRPVGGVYNKVMNFRALDPRDDRAGLAGASDQDRAVWAQFFDPSGGIGSVELHAEFARLWLQTEASGDTEASREVCEREADRLVKGLDLDDLMALWARKRTGRPRKPPVQLGRRREFDREPLVVAIARKRADFRCEVPDCVVPLFIATDGLRFVEVHHIRMLAQGGEDTPENVACLCPLHHREAHHGQEAVALAEVLRGIRDRDR